MAMTALNKQLSMPSYQSKATVRRTLFLAGAAVVLIISMPHNTLAAKQRDTKFWIPDANAPSSDANTLDYCSGGAHTCGPCACKGPQASNPCQTVDGFGSNPQVCLLPYFLGGTVDTDAMCGGMNTDVSAPKELGQVAEWVVFRNTSGWLHVTLLMKCDYLASSVTRPTATIGGMAYDMQLSSPGAKGLYSCLTASLQIPGLNASNPCQPLKIQLDLSARIQRYSSAGPGPAPQLCSSPGATCAALLGEDVVVEQRVEVPEAMTEAVASQRPVVSSDPQGDQPLPTSFTYTTTTTLKVNAMGQQAAAVTALGSSSPNFAMSLAAYRLTARIWITSPTAWIRGCSSSDLNFLLSDLGAYLGPSSHAVSLAACKPGAVRLSGSAATPACAQPGPNNQAAPLFTVDVSVLTAPDPATLAAVSQRLAQLNTPTSATAGATASAKLQALGLCVQSASSMGVEALTQLQVVVQADRGSWSATQSGQLQLNNPTVDPSQIQLELTLLPGPTDPTAGTTDGATAGGGSGSGGASAVGVGSDSSTSSSGGLPGWAVGVIVASLAFAVVTVVVSVFLVRRKVQALESRLALKLLSEPLDARSSSIMLVLAGDGDAEGGMASSPSTSSLTSSSNGTPMVMSPGGATAASSPSAASPSGNIPDVAPSLHLTPATTTCKSPFAAAATTAAAIARSYSPAAQQQQQQRQGFFSPTAGPSQLSPFSSVSSRVASGRPSLCLVMDGAAAGAEAVAAEAVAKSCLQARLSVCTHASSVSHDGSSVGGGIIPPVRHSPEVYQGAGGMMMPNSRGGAAVPQPLLQPPPSCSRFQQQQEQQQGLGGGSSSMEAVAAVAPTQRGERRGAIGELVGHGYSAMGLGAAQQQGGAATAGAPGRDQQ